MCNETETLCMLQWPNRAETVCLMNNVNVKCKKKIHYTLLPKVAAHFVKLASTVFYKSFDYCTCLPFTSKRYLAKP